MAEIVEEVTTLPAGALGAREDFRCERCGGCCVGEGVVWLTDKDVRDIADYLGLNIKEFLKQYTRRFSWSKQFALIDKDDAAISCIFLERGGCRVHPVKPRQCVTFPYGWTREDAEEICPAIQKLLAWGR